MLSIQNSLCTVPWMDGLGTASWLLQALTGFHLPASQPLLFLVSCALPLSSIKLCNLGQFYLAHWYSVATQKVCAALSLFNSFRLNIMHQTLKEASLSQTLVSVSSKHQNYYTVLRIPFSKLDLEGMYKKKARILLSLTFLVWNRKNKS